MTARRERARDDGRRAAGSSAGVRGLAADEEA
jgi:hypothetical protein